MDIWEKVFQTEGSVEPGPSVGACLACLRNDKEAVGLELSLEETVVREEMGEDTGSGITWRLRSHPVDFGLDSQLDGRPCRVSSR